MKTTSLIFVIVCLGVTFGRMTEDQLISADKECIKELNLSMEYVLQHYHDDWTLTENDHDINAIALCTYRKLNFVNSDDTLNAENLQKFFVGEFLQLLDLELPNPEESVQNALENCKTIEGFDTPDTLLKHYNCVVHYITKHV